jgi:hypothetical protein
MSFFVTVAWRVGCASQVKAVVCASCVVLVDVLYVCVLRRVGCRSSRLKSGAPVIWGGGPIVNMGTARRALGMCMWTRRPFGAGVRGFWRGLGS